MLNEKKATAEKQYVVVFIDAFLKKNEAQHNVMQSLGLTPLWLQSNLDLGKSGDNFILLSRSFIKRTWYIFRLLLKQQHNIHHIELYPGGRYAVVLLLLTKLFGLKSICCERGDLYYYQNKKYSPATRWSMKMVYTYCTLIWTRELYAAAALQKLKITTPQFFIHNTVPVPERESYSSLQKKDIDFLWINSSKDFRKMDWFVDGLKTPSLKNCTAFLCGINENNTNKKIYASQDELIKEVPVNLTITGYVDPVPYYRRAKFFVLPASLIYANHALLEAMSYGVVPIITAAEGASEIVSQNIDGWITSFTKEDFTNAMASAFLICEDEYNTMSNNARKKIIAEFSDGYYKQRLLAMYNAIKSL